MRSLSIVIPAMNEEQALPGVLSELQEVIGLFLGAYTTEIIVVDDHSVDNTASVAQMKGVSVVSNQYGCGKGNALRYGFERAKGEFIAMLDGDGSHKAEDLPVLLKPLEEGAGLVIGSRILGGSEEYTRIRAFGNIFLTYAFGFFHGRYLSDALNGYKVFRREVFDNFRYTSSDFEIEIELLANALRSNYAVVEVPSHERRRRGGQAKSRIVRHGLKFMARVIRESIQNGFVHPGAIRSVASAMRPATENSVLSATHLADLRLLYAMTWVVAHTLDPRELLLGNLRAILKTLNAASGSIILLDEEGQCRDGCLIFEGKPHSVAITQLADIADEGLVGWVIRNRAAALVSSTHTDPRWLRRPWDEREVTARSAISIPILSTDRVIGAITFLRPQANAFTPADLELLAGIPLDSSFEEKVQMIPVSLNASVLKKPSQIVG